MSELIAKPVIKNKFWVVEDSGNKVATIQARDDGGYAYVHAENREYFPSVKNLKQKYKIKFGSLERPKVENSKTVYGYPVSGKAYNQVWDIQRRLPIYSKTLKSKNIFCPGYYLIKLHCTWIEHFCPKNITVGRYEYLGPFKTKDEMNKTLKAHTCKN